MFVIHGNRWCERQMESIGVSLLVSSCRDRRGGVKISVSRFDMCRYFHADVFRWKVWPASKRGSTKTRV